MSRHPGLGPEYSGRDDFFSDANLNLRASAATAGDFAPGPNEDVSGIFGQGASISRLALPDIEVDKAGQRSDTVYAAPDLNAAALPYPTPPPPTVAPAIDIDGLADLILARVQQKLLGEQ